MPIGGLVGIIGLSAALAWLPVAQAADARPELLVRNALLITMEPGQEAPFEGYFTVDGTGRITELRQGDPPAALTANRVIDAAGRIVAPGFISAHSHIYMSPLRGLGHDQNLYGWFKAWDRYLRHTTAEDIYWFTLHGALDFLRNGITTAYDFTYSGLNEQLSDDPSIAQGPGTLKPGPFEENQIRAKLDSGLRFINSVWLPELGTDDDIRARFEALLAWATPMMADDQFFKMAISGQQQFAPTHRTARLEAAFMRDYGLMNQSHFLESPNAVAVQQEKFNWYLEAGALGPDFIFGHFIHVNDDILAAVQETGARMSWQPTSNGRLADGIADVVRYRELGIPVAVGLDDQSCTDVSDPYQNLRIGLYTMRALHQRADAMSVYDMLYLHTLGSAKVLNIDTDVGSLAPGKFADFLLVDMRSPDTGPLYDPLASYVLAASLRNLKQVYVGGAQVTDGIGLLTYDERRLRREIDRRTDHIRRIADGEAASASL
ncbi:MAG: amidohydrolase family protein [Gammaproteobacteria bacterium]|nr:amidohydrolase family protein [Gammaproteobacteria bacterium]MCY4343823.1 amidohydrolase family protein [Gammaproteobacteria bacterium]